MVKRTRKRKGLKSEQEKKKANKARWYHIKRKYGLTPDQWFAILEEQHGRCFICQRTVDQIKKSRSRYLTVDHCHKTGRIRGLLCVNCNGNILPAINESAEMAVQLLLYLTRNKSYGITPDHKVEHHG